MIKVLMSCFLSFMVSGAAVCDASLMPLADSFNPNAISYETRETASYRVGLIGRHDYLQVKRCEDLGIQKIQGLSQTYNTTVLTDFRFHDKYTTVETTTVSTTETLSQERAVALNLSLGLDFLNVSTEFSYKEVYTVSETKTYTTSTTVERESDYTLREEYLEPGHKFQLCMAAETYKITYKTWSVDDWWWGDMIVSGTEIEHIAYVTVSPFVTIEFDGELIVE